MFFFAVVLSFFCYYEKKRRLYFWFRLFIRKSKQKLFIDVHWINFGPLCVLCVCVSEVSTWGLVSFKASQSINILYCTFFCALKKRPSHADWSTINVWANVFTCWKNGHCIFGINHFTYTIASLFSALTRSPYVSWVFFYILSEN